MIPADIELRRLALHIAAPASRKPRCESESCFPAPSSFCWISVHNRHRKTTIAGPSTIGRTVWGSWFLGSSVSATNVHQVQVLRKGGGYAQMVSDYIGKGGSTETPKSDFVIYGRLLMTSQVEMFLWLLLCGLTFSSLSHLGSAAKTGHWAGK